MEIAIAFAPRYNSPNKRADAGEFQREANRFLQTNFTLERASLVLINNRDSKSEQRNAVLQKLERATNSQLMCVAFFCHGWKTGIQFGFDLETVDELANAIGRASYLYVSVPLYTCSTAKGRMAGCGRDAPGGDGGFADELRDALCRYGRVRCTVDAHDRPGHTTRNPYVRRFEGMGSPVGGVGGYYLISPRHKLWETWVKRLRDSKDTLRYRYAMLGTGEVFDALHHGHFLP